ncbi:hypothetical protein EYR40_008264 [Pleurotus pulmonarius]|nr:hypothetical protein EYR40_008264 [Pleurotus pulmonarius]
MDLVYASLAVSIPLLVWNIAKPTRKIPLPPGPPADPLIGHLLRFPSENPEAVFHEWSKQYALFACRMGWDPDVVFLPYGQRFRKHRKLFHTYFMQKSCLQFQPVQLHNSHLLVHGLMKNEGNHNQLLARFTTAIAIRIAYGHQIISDDDEYIDILDTMGDAVRAGGLPGATPIDAFPILQHFPSWFPGTHYANAARAWRWAIRRLYDLPYDSVRKQMAEGSAKPSVLAMQLEAAAGRALTVEEIEDMKGTAAIIYAAGAETTWTAISTFLLAMVLYPECQKIGQEEVDRVVGRDRLPTFEDRDSLPYIDCVIQEVLRWHPVTPLGIPHRSTHDDIYRGMFIPKGSYIIFNETGMSLDPNIYANPTAFNPARFLPKSAGGNAEPPFDAAFGYGRRICPGRHLATASLWIAIATIFSTLHISKARDENGMEITPPVEFEKGISSQPKPFPCNIAARSDTAARIIAEAIENSV